MDRTVRNPQTYHRFDQTNQRQLCAPTRRRTYRVGLVVEAADTEQFAYRRLARRAK
ncbi:hypothetical protein [Haloferax marisrubri]|uniref:hypothetical protein n=1 Tax=Haloferax marisrubri TaxID=1544719 RepID=UPI000ACD589B|nr:hypothetical protein [Haloferax marisrubri]